MSLNNILALASLKAYIPYLPLATVIVSGLFIVIAFIVGFVKGGARVCWGGLSWLVSALAFAVLDRYAHEKNPVYKALQYRGFSITLVDFFASFTLALACVFAVLIIYGVFAKLLRKDQELKLQEEKEKQAFEKAIKYGSYEGFDIDQTDNSLRLKPTFIGRIFGGFLCAVNMLMALATVVSAVLLVVDTTLFKQGAMSPIYNVATVNRILPWIKRYALDFVIIGIIFATATWGAKRGFTEGIRLFVIWFGVIGALIVSFYLPFSRFVPRNSFLSVTVSRFVALASKTGWNQTVYTVCAKIGVGLIFAVMSTAVLLVVNLLLKALSNRVSGGLFGAIDKILAGVTFLIVGALLCAFIWAILYACTHYGVLRMFEITRGQSILSSGFFDFYDVFLQPWLVRFSNFVQRIF